MASAERFALFPCDFIHSGGTLALAQMQGFAISPDAQISEEYAHGAVDRKAAIEVASNPSITFETQDLTTYWGAVSPTVGLAVATSTGATFRLQERATLDGVWETSTTHETYTVSRGILIPESVEASQDDERGAVVSSRHVCLYDGTNLPIVKNTGVDFSAATTPAFTSKFFLGPVYHNSSELKGVISSRVEFGIEFAPRRTSGAVYASLGSIVRRAPTISITMLKVDALSSVNAFLRALSGTFAVYYWKATASANRTAVASTVHAKFSASAGAWNDESISVQDNGDATATIRIRPTSTIAVSVASAIP
jgi:hypothetical protein